MIFGQKVTDLEGTPLYGQEEGVTVLGVKIRKVVFDDWSWKINKLFWEKSSDVPNEALISLVCKCRLLGLTNAQRPNQQIHISTVRKYMQILEGLYCYMHMLEQSVIEITTLTEKDD